MPISLILVQWYDKSAHVTMCVCQWLLCALSQHVPEHCGVSVSKGGNNAYIGRAMWLLFRPESHPFPLHLLELFKHVFTVERTCSMKYIQLIQLQRTVWRTYCADIECTILGV